MLQFLQLISTEVISNTAAVQTGKERSTALADRIFKYYLPCRSDIQILPPFLDIRCFARLK
jgi:hypothetical protein